MNRYLVLYMIIFISIPAAFAQKERIEYLPNFDKRTIHFGYYLGINKNSFEINYFDQRTKDSPVFPIPDQDMFVSVDASLGFNIGFVIDYRLHNNINLRFEPGLMSNAKTITFIDPNLYDDSGNILYPTSTTNPVREVSGTYLHLPLLLKLSTNRLNNIRPYVIGGVSYDYNFSSNEKNGKDNFEQEFRMTSSNFMYEVGVGVDFYMYFFKFNPSIRGVFAMNKEMIKDYKTTNNTQYYSPWTGPNDFIGTRGIYFNLRF